MKTALKPCINNEKGWEQEVKNITKELRFSHILFSFFRIASENKVLIIEKTENFIGKLITDHWNKEQWKKGWEESINILAYEVVDIPYCTALMAKTLIFAKEKHHLKW